VVFVDADNRPVQVGSDPADSPAGSGLISPRTLTADTRDTVSV
jgi:aspartate 1-decarboxylase